jgi:uncharacterized protein (DUF3084 family)
VWAVVPAIESLATGGIVAAVLVAAKFLVDYWRRAAVSGDSLSEQRVGHLMDDFEAFRKRVEIERLATDSELRALRSELSDYRVELAAAREALRRCARESHDLKLEVDRLSAEVERINGG